MKHFLAVHHTRRGWHYVYLKDGEPFEYVSAESFASAKEALAAWNKLDDKSRPTK